MTMTPNKFYTGVGSRETPKQVLWQMTQLAFKYQKEGLWLRSGAALGADRAFEAGAGQQKEIWLPWLGFMGHSSYLVPSEEAFVMAAHYHPAWHRCNIKARCLHARNCHQVLGADLKTPSEFLVCWTRTGAAFGGTGQAIRVANGHGIKPIFLKEE